MSRRFLAGVGLVVAAFAAAVTFALPAEALAPTGSIDQPPTDGLTFSTYPIGFAVHFADPYGVMDDVSLTVTLAGKSGPVGQVDFPGCGCPSEQHTWAFTPLSNGKYTFTAVGTGEDRPPDGSSRLATTLTRTFFFSAPPVTPTGLSATPDTSTRVVKVAWSANPEPDIFGYVIERKAPTGTTFTQIAGVDGTTTSFTDTQVAQAPPGEYDYEVIAVRKSGDGQSYLQSAPSRAAAAAVSGAPITTTTTTATTAPGSGKGVTTPTTGAGPGGTLAPAPALPPPVPADAGNFRALVNQAHASSVTTEPPDPGFNPRLPFAPQTTQQIVNVPDATQLASGATLGGDGGERRRLTYEYLAGGLVLFMLAMHALYLKRQVEQAAALEPLEVSLSPESVVARSMVDPI
jgi:hypothetical protein